MHETGRRTPVDGGGIDDEVHADGVGDSPLRPDERAIYATDQAAGDGSSDRDGLSPAQEPRTWFMVGLGLFLLFLGILTWAVLQPLLG